MSLSVHIAARDLNQLATYVHSGVLELNTKSFFHRSKWHQRYVVICKDKSCRLSLFIFENHLAEKAEAVYSVKEFESVRNYENAEKNITGFAIKFENPKQEPLVCSCDTEKSRQEWMEHINNSILKEHKFSNDSAYASGGSACKDSSRRSKPYFTIDESDMIVVEEIPQGINNDNDTSSRIADSSSTTTVNQKDVSANENVLTAHNVLHGCTEEQTHEREIKGADKDNVGNCETTVIAPIFQIQESKDDIPKDTSNEEETSRKFTEASCTTTVKITDVSIGGRVKNSGENHNYVNVVPMYNFLHEADKTDGLEDAVKDRIDDKDKTHVKTVASIPVQESKGKSVAKERMRGLPIEQVQVSDDEDPHYENVSHVFYRDENTVQMENLKPPIHDSDSDHSAREEASTGQGCGHIFESGVSQSAPMLSVRQPQSSQMRAESLDTQSSEAQHFSERETLHSCSSSFSSIREGKGQMTLQIDGQQTSLSNKGPVSSKPVSSNSSGHSSFTKPDMSSRKNAKTSRNYHEKIKPSGDSRDCGPPETSNKSGGTGSIKKTRNLSCSDSSNSVSSVGSDSSLKYETAEDEHKNIFKREDYFCPDRKQAIRQIKESPVGTFLVYLNHDKCEVICFMTNLGPKSFEIRSRADGYSLFKPSEGTVFSTIDELLTHYHFNNLPSTKYKVTLQRVYKSK